MEPGESFDGVSEPAGAGGGERAIPARPFVGILFACCDVYSRIYVNRRRTAFEGHCPRCGRPARVRIGPGGTDERFFTAY